LTRSDIQIIWQTGDKDLERCESKRSPAVWVGKFIDRMECAYAAADAVLCRSGATTLAELTRLGKPAILAPYPHAAANHQEFNAQTLVNAGAAVMVKDADLPAKALSAIKEILLNDGKRRAMAEKSLRLGKPEAGKEIAKKVLALGRSTIEQQQ